MSPAQLDQLERLARLKADGALDDGEYAAAKARVLDGAHPAPASPPTRPAYAATATQPTDPGRLSPTWQLRFRFMDEHGLPGTPTYKRAYRQLRSWDRSRATLSIPGMAFGPFYLIYLGLWRPALSLLAASLVYGMVVGQLGLSDTLDRAAWVVPAVCFGLAAVPLYYLKVRRGIHSWNPLVWRSA